MILYAIYYNNRYVQTAKILMNHDKVQRRAATHHQQAIHITWRKFQKFYTSSERGLHLYIEKAEEREKGNVFM